jgi:hypothetical protein
MSETTDQKAEAKQDQKVLDEAMGQIKKEIIEHYDNIRSQIDLRTETLLMHLPEALKQGKDELLERVREEKEKSLAALADDSPLIRHKNEYYQRFLTLKEEYNNCGDDKAKQEEIEKKLEELKKDVEILEEFLEDFKNRTLCFEEADDSVYSALIGELVSYEEYNKKEITVIPVDEDESEPE